VRSALVVLTVAAAAAVVPLATAGSSVELQIRPGVAIGKVALGMSPAQVRRALGRHRAVEENELLPSGRRSLVLEWGWGKWTVAFEGLPGRLRAVRVGVFGEPRHRTPEGVGAGTLLGAVERLLDVRCREGFSRASGVAKTSWCVKPAASGNQTWVVVQEQCRVDLVNGNCLPGRRYSAVAEVIVAERGQQLPVILGR
jgi:hypothetical protein